MIYLSILIYFITSVYLYPIDDFFQFTKADLPEVIEYEKERKLCIAPFINKTQEEYLTYLESGIPSILSAGLYPVEKVFDPKVIPVKIFHSFGDQSKYKDKLKNKEPKFFNSKILEDLNSGKIEILPEKDPRYIQLKTIILKDDVTENVINYYSKKNNCFYFIFGSFDRTGNDRLSTQFELINFQEKSKKNFSIETSLKRAYQEMKPKVNELADYMINRELTYISIDAGEEKGAMIFLDDIYIGQTPLKDKSIPVGKHKLSIQKEGFIHWERIIDPKPGATSLYEITLKQPEKLAVLSVYSEPEGADVYIGTSLLGKTPLKNIKVVSGLNRIKISKEYYIDYYEGVDFEDHKNFVVKAKLKEGDTTAYYKNRLNFFQDHSYYDFVNYSVSSVILFYLSAGYGHTKMGVTSDNMRTQIMDNLAFFSLLNTPNVSGDYLLNLYLYENSLVQRNERKVRYFRDIRNGSAVAGSLMLFMAFGFYWLGTENDGINFGFDQIQTHWGRDSLSSFYYTHRF